MTIKLIAVDMDGTFLNDANTYNHDRFADQLRALTDKGIHFAAASGSQYQRLVKQFTEFKHQMDFISDNGAIVHARDELLFASQIPDDLIVQTLQTLKTHFPQPFALTTVSGVRSAYVDGITPDPVFEHIKLYYDALDRLTDLFDVNPQQLADQVVKIALTFDPTRVTPAQAATLPALLDPHLTALNSGFDTQDIGLTGITKATGLQHLQERYHVANDELATFGDNENDLDMLTMTPHGYAMANAHKSIIDQAPKQAGHNNDDGVLNVIDQILAAN
ncbi:Cof-type HAD-IIB family hydrolase [Furfurilactobacillus sp. WILCCON 0119]